MFFIPMSFYEWGLCSWGFIMMITEAFYWRLEHCYLSACIWWRPLCWTKSAFPLMNIVASNGTIFYKAITKWGKWGKTWMLILLLVIEFWITLLWSFGEPSMHWVTTCRKHAKNNSVCVLHSKAQNDRTADFLSDCESDTDNLHKTKYPSAPISLAFSYIWGHIIVLPVAPVQSDQWGWTLRWSNSSACSRCWCGPLHPCCRCCQSDGCKRAQIP